MGWQNAWRATSWRAKVVEFDLLSNFDILRYIACEPALKTFRGLTQMRNEILGDGMEISLNCCGSEDFQLPKESVNLVFTSPPYFNLGK